MPKGKGTYGSQVGRHPKKQKKYYGGGKVGMNADPFSTKNTKGVPAEKYAEEVDKANKMEELNKTLEPDTAPTANAQERSQTFQMGGNVLEYKEGGKVDITDVVKTVGRYEKADKTSARLLLDPELPTKQKEGVASRKKMRKELKKQKVSKMKKGILK